MKNYIPLQFAEEILKREDHRLVADYCPNPGAYQCDRRKRRVYNIPALKYMLVIETEGNIAAGDEPEAYLLAK